MKLARATLILVALGPAGTLGAEETRRQDATPPGYEETGTASWYGKAHQGKPTASGEKFDRDKPTAAHPTLPLGSTVEVTNLENGKSTEVKVNDRGPYVDDRAIDLSEHAAKKLGMKEDGLAPVKIEAAKDPAKAAEKPD